MKQSTKRRYYGRKLIDIYGMLIGKNSVLNKYMVSAIVIIAKRQPQHTYIVKAEDWLNPKMCVIDAQDPYTGDTAVILKSQYKIGWVIDENGEASYSF